MSLQIQFDFPFFGTIRTREQVQATLHFRVAPALADHLKCSFGFKSEERLYNEIGRELHAKAESATGRWALQFPSANAALDPSAYASLEASLRAIASTLFTITSATVSNIVPVTPEPEAPKEEIVPPRPKSEDELIREKLLGKAAKARSVLDVESEIRRADPELANHPTWGLNTQEVLHPFTGHKYLRTGALKQNIEAEVGELLK